MNSDPGSEFENVNDGSFTSDFSLNRMANEMIGRRPTGQRSTPGVDWKVPLVPPKHSTAGAKHPTGRPVRLDVRDEGSRPGTPFVKLPGRVNQPTMSEVLKWKAEGRPVNPVVNDEGVRRNLEYSLNALSTSVFEVGGSTTRAPVPEFMTEEERIRGQQEIRKRNKERELSEKRTRIEELSALETRRITRIHELADLNGKFKHVNQQLNLLSKARDEYQDDNDELKLKLGEESNAMQLDLEKQRKQYNKAIEKLKRTTDELTVARNKQVQENEGLRTDILTTNKRMLEDRQTLADECADLISKRDILEGYVRQVQGSVGAPDMTVIPARTDDTASVDTPVYVNTSSVPVPDDSVVTNVNVTGGILKHKQYDPFVKPGATQHVDGGVYKGGQPALSGGSVTDRKQQAAAPVSQVGMVQQPVTNPGNGNVYHGNQGYPTNGTQYVQGNQSYQQNGNSGRVNRNSQHSGASVNNQSSVYYTGMNSSTQGGGDDPNRRPNRRQSMSGTLRSLYDRSPAIQGLGVDCFSRKTDGSEVISWSISQCNRLRGDVYNAARRVAAIPRPYDGTIAWEEWFGDFMDDMDSNGWSWNEALPHLLRCLRSGPGKMAVDQWRIKFQNQGNFSQLVECASYMLCDVVAEDPMMAFRKRSQKPKESHRTFGLFLQNLLHKARPYVPMDDEYFLNDLFTQYVQGLRDADQSAAAYHAWNADSSLADLFLAVDTFNKKRTLTAGKIPQRVSSLGMPPLPELPGRDQESDYEIIEVEEEDGTISAVRFPRNEKGRKFIPRKQWSGNKVVKPDGGTIIKKTDTKEYTDGTRSGGYVKPVEKPLVKPETSTVVKPLEGIITKEVMDQLVEQITQRLNPSRNLGKLDRSIVKCFRCQVMGHFASECTAPAPIYRKTSAVFVEGEEEEQVLN